MAQVYDQVVFHQHVSAGHIVPHKGHFRGHDEGIAINMGIGVFAGIQNSVPVQEADVVAKRIVDAFAQAEHDAAAAVAVAVVVLVEGAVTGIRVPGPAVLVEAGMVGFVVLKQSILALPGPHGRGGLPQPGAFLGVDPVVDLRGDVFGHVPPDQGLVAIHGG